MSEELTEPRFDFSKVRGAWRREMVRSTALETRVTAMVNRVTMDPNNTEEDIDAAMEQLDALEKAQGELMAQVLVEIPASWLVAGAPDDLDTSDPTFLDWVRQDHRVKLYFAMMEAANRPAGKR